MPWTPIFASDAHDEIEIMLLLLATVAAGAPIS